jgi:cell division protein FtsB
MHPYSGPQTAPSRSRLSALKTQFRLPTPNEAWSTVFVLWLLFLTGAFASMVGSPGVVQAVRLRNLLTAKQKVLEETRLENAKLQKEANDLEKNRAIQLREIRRVLGYAAPDELVFDFSGPNPL